MAHRVYNFAPGPATLPLETLERAQKDLVDFEGTGISIVEHSHRGKDYARVHDEAKALVRTLFGVPDDYHVLFLQGGARMQFGMIPLNFLGDGRSADYVLTGTWSKKAIADAQVVGEARVAASTEQDGVFRRVPRPEELDLDPKAAYLHLTANNTIFGTQFFDFPDTGDVPLVADMTSDLGWAPIDVSRFGLVYAAAQKNLGISGVTLVLIRDDLVQKGRKDLPEMLRYDTYAESDSLANTAPTFAIYMLRNVLAWTKDQGGLEGMEKRNRRKGALLYGALDARPDFFRTPVETESRSLMNAVFRLPSEALEKTFLSEAAAEGLVNLKGHRSVGGIRVSMYNGMPPEGIEKLVQFIQDFAARHA